MIVYFHFVYWHCSQLSDMQSFRFNAICVDVWTRRRRIDTIKVEVETITTTLRFQLALYIWTNPYLLITTVSLLFYSFTVLSSFIFLPLSSAIIAVSLCCCCRCEQFRAIKYVCLLRSINLDVRIEFVHDHMIMCLAVRVELKCFDWHRVSVEFNQIVSNEYAEAKWKAENKIQFHKVISIIFAV